MVDVLRGQRRLFVFRVNLLYCR